MSPQTPPANLEGQLHVSPHTILDGPALWPAQAHVPSVLGRQIVVERGDGCYVYTADGRRLFDGTAGLWHANIGHAHPALAAGLRLLEQGSPPGRVVVQRTAAGRPEAYSDHPGFLALASPARCQPLPNWSADRRSYYPATLMMLAQTALREGGCNRR